MRHRAFRGSRFPRAFGQNRQYEKARGEQDGVDSALDFCGKASREQMRIEISEQQNHLEEEKADDPERSGASEPWKYDLCDQRLDLEQEEGAHENREAVDQL